MDARKFTIALNHKERELLMACLDLQILNADDEARKLYTKFSTMDDEGGYPIIFISESGMSDIIETRLPLGRFVTESECDGHILYTGCDNTSGDAWCEDFGTYGECAAWLMDLIDSEGLPTDAINMEDEICKDLLL